jgi:hypothetical protein
MPNITANAGAVQLLGVDGAGSVGVQITGTWVGTLAFQMSMDGGATWTSVNAWPVGAGATVQTTTGNGNWAIPCVGGTYYQVVATAWTSGTAVVTLQTIKSPMVLVPKTNSSGELIVQASAAAGVTTVQGATADGGLPSNPLPMGVLESSTVERLARAINAPWADLSIGKGVTAVNVAGLGVTASLAAPGTVTLSPVGMAAGVIVTLTGTFTGLTFTFQGSPDGSTWPQSLNGYPFLSSTATVNGVTTSASTGTWFVPCSGYQGVRVNVTAIASGTASFTLQAGNAALAPRTDTQGNQQVALYQPNSNTAMNVLGAGADGVNNGLGGYVAPSMNYACNDLSTPTWDRWRNNTDVTALASASYNTTQTVNLKNYNGRGIQVVFDMTAVGATTNWTLAIKNKDAVSGKFITVLTGTAVSTNVTSAYRVYPGLTAVANTDVNGFITRDYQIVVTAGGSLNASTFSVGVQTIL